MLSHYLETDQLSYIVGLLQSDGHHSSDTRNRGKVRVELQASDRPILEALQAAFPVHSHLSERTRDTNFKEAYSSCIWTLYDWETREELIKLGVPVGAKSETVAPPTWAFSPRDYFRGLIDGDGSLGLTGKGWPFVSLTTKSDYVAKAYIEYLRGIIGYEKKASRNTRDNIYNLMVLKEAAQLVARDLYSGCNLRLDRKYESYTKLLEWERPEGDTRRAGNRLWWSSEQDSYIKGHSLSESAAHLGRSLASIKMRLYRIEGKFLHQRRLLVSDSSIRG